jgi:predicted nucleic acid-binding protein
VTGTIVADTSVIFGALDPSDADHVRCSAVLGSGVAVVMPAPVVVEVDWLSRSRGLSGAMAVLLRSVLDGSLLIANLDIEDLARATRLVEQYDDLPLDFVDASVVAIAERLEQATIATLDHRHFSVIRPLHVEAFTLVP